MIRLNLVMTMLLAFLVTGNVWAENESVKTYFSLSDAKVEWNSDNCTFDANTGKMVFSLPNEDYGNAALSWLDYTVTDISGYDNLVLKLKNPSTANIEVTICEDGFWGGAKQSQSYLETGHTELTIALKDLVHNGSTDADGLSADLSNVNLVIIRTGWVHEQTIEIESFYLEKIVTDTEAKDFQEIDVNAGYSKAGSPSANGTLISFTSYDDKWAWNLSSINSTLYEYLVVVPRKPFLEDGKNIIYGVDYGANNVVSGWGFAYGYWQKHRGLVYDLNDNLIYDNWEKTSYATDGEYYTSSRDENGNLTFTPGLVNNFYVCRGWDGDAEGDFEISAIYLTNQTPKYDASWAATEYNCDYLRTTTDIDAYGTVCLPYAAAICGADAYEVVGVDNASNPTKLYLNEVYGVLQAGKPYVYKTNTANTDGTDWGGSVVFYKAGENTVAAPVSGGALEGSFSDATEVPSTSYVLSNGKWVKGTGNTINANHAYLTLSEDLEVPESSAAKYTVMSISGGVTGINSIDAEKVDDDATYNLNGVRVSNPSKGLYIKNGKKYIAK